MAALPLFHSRAARFLAGPRLEAILWLRKEEKRDLGCYKRMERGSVSVSLLIQVLGDVFHLLPAAYDEMFHDSRPVCLILFEENNCRRSELALPNKFSLPGTKGRMCTIS